MKKILFLLPLLLSIECFSQFNTHINLISEAAFPFNEEIHEIIKKAINKKFRKIEFKINGIEYKERPNNINSTIDSTQTYLWYTNITCEILKKETILISIHQKPWDTKNVKNYCYKYNKGLYSFIGNYEKKSSAEQIKFKIYQTQNNRKTYQYNSRDTSIIKVYQYDTVSTMHGKFNRGFHIEKKLDSNLVEEFYIDKYHTLLKSKKTFFSEYQPYQYFHNTNKNTVTDLSIYENYQVETNTTFSKDRLSKHHYIQTKIEKVNESSLKNDVVTKIKYEYLINKKKLPISIEIVEYIINENYFAPGSTLTIQYWK